MQIDETKAAWALFVSPRRDQSALGLESRLSSTPYSPLYSAFPADWAESQRKKRSISSTQELQFKFQMDEETATSLVLVRKATLVVGIRRKERHYSGGATKTVLAAKQVLPLGDDGTGINLDYVVVDRSNVADDGGTTKIEFDVTHAVQHWILEPEENAGLTVGCKSGCEEIELVNESEARMEVSTVSKNMDVSGSFRRSLMYHVDFTESEKKAAKNDYPVEEDGAEDDDDAEELDRHRTRESIRNHKKKKSRGRRVTASRRGLHRRRKKSSLKRRKCCRAPMKVPLSSETGYAFVVRPDFIEARACHGKCPFGHLPRDAHSDIQNLMRRLEGKHIPRPCCVPARTSAKALLHLDPKRKGKLEVTFWKDIVVEECTCA